MEKACTAARKDEIVHFFFNHQPHKMAKFTQTIRRLLPTNCLSVFDQFVVLTLKRSTDYQERALHSGARSFDSLRDNLLPPHAPKPSKTNQGNTSPTEQKWKAWWSTIFSTVWGRKYACAQIILRISGILGIYVKFKDNFREFGSFFQFLYFFWISRGLECMYASRFRVNIANIF